jgi:Cytochrome C oxidase, cbb3-type, subunit III
MKWYLRRHCERSAAIQRRALPPGLLRFARNDEWTWVRTAMAALALLLAIPATAQQDTKIENPFRGVMQDRTSRSADERLYVEKCSMCHRQMGMGTVILARRMDPKVARLEVRTDLTAEYITLTVRQGIGNMPRISRAEVSDPELARITRYLLKNNGETVK